MHQALTIADPVIDRLWRWLESEASSCGDGDDRTSEDDQAGHDHQDVELWQTNDGDEAGRVHDGVVH